MEEPIKNLNKIIDDLHRELEAQKLKRNRCKSVIHTCLQFIFNNPDILQEVGITLQKCIIYHLTLDPIFKSEMIGGDFTLPEK